MRIDGRFSRNWRAPCCVGFWRQFYNYRKQKSTKMIVFYNFSYKDWKHRKNIGKSKECKLIIFFQTHCDFSRSQTVSEIQHCKVPSSFLKIFRQDAAAVTFLNPPARCLCDTKQFGTILHNTYSILYSGVHCTV